MVVDPSKYVEARIVERRDHTRDLWTIRVAHDSDFTHKPGQYATIGVVHEDRVLERPYSIVSSPAEPTIEFLLELVPDGALTPHLYPLQPGARLLMRRRAKGLFLLDLPSQRTHHLLLSTVTGVAPFVSMVRTLAHHRTEPLPEGLQIVCIQGGSQSHEFGYDRELIEFDRQCAWFHYIPTISRHWEDPGWTGERGRVEDIIRKYTDMHGVTPETGIAYLCGHPGMISGGEAIMKRAGFDAKWVRQEEYWPAGKAPLDADERAEAAALSA